MALLDVFYNTVVRRNSIYVGFIIAGAFIGDKVVNDVGDKLWETHNAGKLFKDIKGEEAEE